MAGSWGVSAAASVDASVATSIDDTSRGRTVGSMSSIGARQGISRERAPVGPSAVSVAPIVPTRQETMRLCGPARSSRAPLARISRSAPTTRSRTSCWTCGSDWACAGKAGGGAAGSASGAADAVGASARMPPTNAVPTRMRVPHRVRCAMYEDEGRGLMSVVLLDGNCIPGSNSGRLRVKATRRITITPFPHKHHQSQ